MKHTKFRSSLALFSQAKFPYNLEMDKAGKYINEMGN